MILLLFIVLLTTGSELVFARWSTGRFEINFDFFVTYEIHNIVLIIFSNVVPKSLLHQVDRNLTILNVNKHEIKQVKNKYLINLIVHGHLVFAFALILWFYLVIIVTAKLTKRVSRYHRTNWFKFFIVLLLVSLLEFFFKTM